MKVFSLIILLGMMVNSSKLDIDFGIPTGGENWMVINDGVMGGLSEGDAKLTEKSILFEGKVSLANNGGFASLRCPYQDLDLSDYKTIKMRVRSQGIAFAFTLSTDRRFYIPYFKHDIKTKSNKWQTITLDLADFKQYQLGNATGVSLTQDYKDQIIRMGVISNEKREGSFELEIDYIKFE
ncbi:MAG: CIA30 family protein [Aureispira sp.]|nr:CIA30 family protein [Aureispira sp.]